MFSACVTLKFDGWPRKTIEHLFYTMSRFVQNFKHIGEMRLDLQSGNSDTPLSFGLTPRDKSHSKNAYTMTKRHQRAT